MKAWDEARYERYLEGRDKRRHTIDAKAEAKLDRQYDKAEIMVGEVCREGKTVYYIYPIGGRYREGPKHELVDFLIRNRYV